MIAHARPQLALKVKMLAYPTRPDMLGRVGLVVPVWFPDDLPDAECETLLRTTLAD